MTSAPPGEMTYGPFTDYQLVTTDHGVYGLRQGHIMWLEPRMVYDPKEQREVEIMMPVYEEVVGDPGPLPYSPTAPTNRTPFLGNWEQGVPYVPEGADAPAESPLLAKLTEAITLLVAQQTGQTMNPIQAEVSAVTLVQQNPQTPEELTEAIEALTVEETDDGEGQERTGPTGD